MAGAFAARRPLAFHRFEKNLGGASLVAHWNRCLARTAEPWVWLFSDDDIMDPACVASFYDELRSSHGRHALYRFNTRNIDAEGRLLIENEPHPVLESGADFLRARLEDRRTSTMQELVFSRAACARAGGIPEFPLAWSSDDAFTASMGAHQAIKTIGGPRVGWRQSGVSISTHLSPANARGKIAASQMLVVWAMKFLADHPPSGAPLAVADLQNLTSVWFFRRVYYNHTYLNLKTCLAIDRFAAATWGWPRGRGLAKCFELNRPIIKQGLRGRMEFLRARFGMARRPV